LKAGGNASHIAKALKMLNFNTREIGFYLKIGANYIWKDIFQGFDNEGILFSKEDCNQVIFKANYSNLEFLEYQQKTSNEVFDFPDMYINSQYIFIGAITSTHAEYIINQVKGTIAFNYSPWFNNEKLFNLLPNINIFILNRGEALDIYRTDKIVDVFNQIKPYNPKINLIITKDKDGCEYFDGYQHILIPAPNINCVNTLGAGAIFSTLYLYFLQKSKDISYSLSCASVSASIYISSEQYKLSDQKYFNTMCENIYSKTMYSDF
jgi:hypothetical protein